MQRYRVFMWVGPLLALSWLSLAVLPEPVFLDSTIVAGYLLGSLFAHAALSAAWMAFGLGWLIWRGLLSLVWVIMLPIAIGINVRLYGGGADAVVMLGGCLLGHWLVLQIPLWGLAIGFGLRLLHVDLAKPVLEGRRFRFSIRHLLIGMLVMGVALGIGRMAVMLAPVDLFCLFLAAGDTVVTLPLLLAGLKRRKSFPAIVLSLALAGLVTAFEINLLRALGVAGAETAYCIAINFFSAALILFVALVLRLNGYRLCARPVISAS